MNAFGFFNRLRGVERWNVTTCNRPESVLEHTALVAMIGFQLALLHNQLEEEGADPRRLVQQKVDPFRIATLCIHHDAHEVISGDPPSPVKNSSPDMIAAYEGLTKAANTILLDHLPETQRSIYQDLFEPSSKPEKALIKAADRLADLFKCISERQSGNRDFRGAEAAIREKLARGPGAADLFLKHYEQAVELTLDELMAG